MPRPTRIQYDHAFYHVMNRGRGRQTVFHGEAYYNAFLETLSEAHARFGAIIHAYCLMGNHYHLLMETPRGNLDRIMRHINGVYTQRYNRLRETDGSLFRGRYKAILVDADAYLLQLSRYIHRNPVEVRGADVDELDRYKWSSYLAYINKTKPAPWLEREKTYQMLGQRRRYAGYKAFVANGVDDEINNFYGKGNVSAVLGGDEFKEGLVKREADLKVSGDLHEAVMERPSAAVVIQAISMVFNVLPQLLLKRQSGRQRANIPRKMAMYCCQRYGDISLKMIADEFGLVGVGGASSAVSDIKRRLLLGEFVGEVRALEKCLCHMK